MYESYLEAFCKKNAKEIQNMNLLSEGKPHVLLKEK